MSFTYKVVEGLFSAVYATKRSTSSVALSAKCHALNAKNNVVHAARTTVRDAVLAYQDAKLNAKAADLDALVEGIPWSGHEDVQSAAFSEQFEDASLECQAFCEGDPS